MQLPVACKVYAGKSADNHIGFPLCVTPCFSLATFRIFFFSLTFAILIVICLGVGLFGFILRSEEHTSEL